VRRPEALGDARDRAPEVRLVEEVCRLERLSRRRGRSVETVGVDGLPSFSQPYSSAMSWQSGQTSTKFSPSGVNLVARSPISRVRSQTAQLRATESRVIRIRATIAALLWATEPDEEGVSPERGLSQQRLMGQTLRRQSLPRD
jgi:hypothetical protein